MTSPISRRVASGQEYRLSLCAIPLGLPFSPAKDDINQKPVQSKLTKMSWMRKKMMKGMTTIGYMVNRRMGRVAIVSSIEHSSS